MGLFSVPSCPTISFCLLWCWKSLTLLPFELRSLVIIFSCPARPCHHLPLYVHSPSSDLATDVAVGAKHQTSFAWTRDWSRYGHDVPDAGTERVPVPRSNTTPGVTKLGGCKSKLLAAIFLQLGRTWRGMRPSRGYRNERWREFCGKRAPKKQEMRGFRKVEVVRVGGKRFTLKSWFP